METIYIPWTYIYQWLTGSWTEILWSVAYETVNLSCDEIQIALNDVKAPDSYPVDCDFITLSQTGVVFFMDPNTQQLVQSIEINTWFNSTFWFNQDDIIFMYWIETWFICVLILFVTLVRNLRKIAPNLF